SRDDSNQRREFAPGLTGDSTIDVPFELNSLRCHLERPRTNHGDRKTDDHGEDDDLDCPRSEEHTSELQSPYDLVCRHLLEKKKNYFYPYFPTSYQISPYQLPLATDNLLEIKLRAHQTRIRLPRHTLDDDAAKKLSQRL